MKRKPGTIILLTGVLCTPWAMAAEKFPTRDQLNDAGRGLWTADTADVLKPRSLLYESKEDGRYQVSYNLIREDEGDVKGYFVRLTIKNLSQYPITATTDVALIDAESAVISPTDRDTFLGLAAKLADTKIPTATLKAIPSLAAGDASFLQAYLRGQAQGAILKATADSATGRKMTVWADSFWMKSVVELPSRQQISGVRVFLAEPYHPLPLTLRVRVGESQFEFTTRTR